MLQYWFCSYSKTLLQMPAEYFKGGFGLITIRIRKKSIIHYMTRNGNLPLAFYQHSMRQTVKSS